MLKISKIENGVAVPCPFTQVKSKDKRKVDTYELDDIDFSITIEGNCTLDICLTEDHFGNTSGTLHLNNSSLVTQSFSNVGSTFIVDSAIAGDRVSLVNANIKDCNLTAGVINVSASWITDSNVSIIGQLDLDCISGQVKAKCNDYIVSSNPKTVPTELDDRFSCIFEGITPNLDLNLEMFPELTGPSYLIDGRSTSVGRVANSDLYGIEFGFVNDILMIPVYDNSIEGNPIYAGFITAQNEFIHESLDINEIERRTEYPWYILEHFIKAFRVYDYLPESGVVPFMDEERNIQLVTPDTDENVVVIVKTGDGYKLAGVTPIANGWEKTFHIGGSNELKITAADGCTAIIVLKEWAPSSSLYLDSSTYFITTEPIVIKGDNSFTQSTVVIGKSIIKDVICKETDLTGTVHLDEVNLACSWLRLVQGIITNSSVSDSNIRISELYIGDAGVFNSTIRTLSAVINTNVRNLCLATPPMQIIIKERIHYGSFDTFSSFQFVTGDLYGVPLPKEPSDKFLAEIEPSYLLIDDIAISLDNEDISELVSNIIKKRCKALGLEIIADERPLNDMISSRMETINNLKKFKKDK